MRLVADAYGKAAVRLALVERDGERQRLRDLTIDVRLEGDFAAAYRDGDNRGVLPTDTMKNVVYVVAHREGVGELEAFARRLAAEVLGRSPAGRAASVEVAERSWPRIAVAGREHPHAFAAPTGERRLARAVAGDGERLGGGLAGLEVLKTSGSAFSGFLRDDLTTLREARDRILATSVEASWTYGAAATGGFDLAFAAARRALVETFAEHASESVQHTLHAMAEVVLGACPGIDEITLRLPNRHHVPVDLAPFGLVNEGRTFVVLDAPYGLIEGTLRRNVLS